LLFGDCEGSNPDAAIHGRGSHRQHASLGLLTASCLEEWSFTQSA
jgi:hypothetical protein